MPNRTTLTRRAALATIAATPALIAARDAHAHDAVQPARPAPSCVLTPRALEGPFYFDPKMERSEITESNPGAPLRLRFVVMDAATCQPASGARIDVWHARADGLYSGYDRQGDSGRGDTTGKTFMRGTQRADARGEATFRTVYPGWYPGRTPHVHFKIIVDERSVLTGQMYFPDALSQYIYTSVSAYMRKRPRDTFNADDGLALLDKTHGGFCDIREEADHYLATLVVGIDRAASVPSDREMMRAMPPPPPPLRRDPAGIVPGVARSAQRRT